MDKSNHNVHMLREGSRDNQLNVYLSVLQKKGLQMSLSQFKQYMLDKLVREGGIHNLSLDSNFYLAGCTRYYLEGNLTTNKRLNILYPKFADKFNREICQKLDIIILYLRNKYIDSVGTQWEQPEDFGQLPINELFKKYRKLFKGFQVVDIEKKNFSDKAGKNYTYDICLTFEECTKYNSATEPGAWCITYGENYFNQYTRNNNSHFVILRRKGYENVPRKAGPKFPLDAYGLSLIAMQLSNVDGSVVAGTTRWNHGADDTPYRIGNPDADQMVPNEAVLKQLTGIDETVLKAIQQVYVYKRSQMKSDSSSEGAKTRAQHIQEERDIKYKQMLLNNGQPISQVFGEDNFKLVSGNGKLAKSIFLVSLNDWNYLVDRGKIITDSPLYQDRWNKFSTTMDYMDGRFLAIGGGYNVAYIYDKKFHKFAMCNGKEEFYYSVNSSYGGLPKNTSGHFVQWKAGKHTSCLYDMNKGRMVVSPYGDEGFKEIQVYDASISRTGNDSISYVVMKNRDDRFYIYDAMNDKFAKLGGDPDGYRSLCSSWWPKMSYPYFSYKRYSDTGHYIFDLNEDKYIDTNFIENPEGWKQEEIYHLGKTIYGVKFEKNYTDHQYKLYDFEKREELPETKGVYIYSIGDAGYYYYQTAIATEPRGVAHKYFLVNLGDNFEFLTDSNGKKLFLQYDISNNAIEGNIKNGSIHPFFKVNYNSEGSWFGVECYKGSDGKVYAISKYKAKVLEHIVKDAAHSIITEATKRIMLSENKISRAESRARQYLRQLFDEKPQYLDRIKQLFTMHMHNPQLPQNVRQRLASIYQEAERTGEKEPYVQFTFTEFRNEVPYMKGDAVFFLPGVIRMFFAGELRAGTDFSLIGQSAAYLAAQPNMGGYDSDFNGQSYRAVTDATRQGMEDARRRRQEIAAQTDYDMDEAGDYDVIRVNTYEQAHKYAQFNEWCITYGSEHWDAYTNDGNYTVYFMLADGYKNVPKQKGENYPFDDYGLSMISVIVNEFGDLAWCTTRWNEGEDHGDIGRMGISPDRAMDEMQIGKLIGENFYDAFPPKEGYEAPDYGY